MACVPKVKLNNGCEMPAIGLGTYTGDLSNNMQELIESAIDYGYRHIDTALLYLTEKPIGKAVNVKIADGTVKRQDLFIVSKLWNTYHRPDLVVKGCKKTLKNLNLDYIDLYLIHWPTAFKATGKEEEDFSEDLSNLPSLLENREFFPVDENGQLQFESFDYVDTWREMEKCVDLGLVKSIGISNFNSEQVDRLMKHARIKPVTNQVEVHPYMNQKKLTEFCMKHGIVITAYGPLGLQIPVYSNGLPRLVEHPKIVNLAKELGRTPAQIILRYLIQLKTVPIPKTNKLERLKENISVFDFVLNEEQMSVMDSINRNMRICAIPGFDKHVHNPFGIEF